MNIPRGKYMGVRLDKDKDDDPETNPDNYYECEICKQSVYMGDLGQVFYHEAPIHKPMKLDDCKGEIELLKAVHSKLDSKKND